MKTPLLVTLVFLALAGLSFSITVSSCNDNITEVLTSPGLYELNQSVSGAPNVGFGPICIYISSDDVDFNCNGFSITNNGTPAGTYGIFIDGAVNNVTVRNCAGISGYEYGVLVDSVTNGSFTNNTVFNNSNIGIYVSASSNNLFSDNNVSQNSNYGIALNTSSGNDLTNNDASNNLIDGILVESSPDNTLSGNTASGNPNAGFNVLFSDGTILTDNFASSSQFGFHVFASSGVMLDGNNATLASDTGILLNSADSSVLSGNRAFLNTIGFSLSGTITTNLTDNTAEDNSFNGFYLHTGSANNILTSNQALNNSLAGFQMLAASTNNVFITNIANNNSGPGFLLNGTSGNNLTGNSAADNPLGFILDSGANNNILVDNLADSNSNGFRLTSSSGNNLTDNIATDNVFDTYDLNDADNNFFFGNVGSGGFDAFTLSGSDNNVFTSNNGSGHSFDGFGLFNSTGNNFTGNTMFDGFDGFNLFQSDDNIFTGNDASGYIFNGFSVSNSDDVLMQANSVSGGFEGFSLFNSTGAILINNIASGGSVEGISLSSSNDATLSGNTVSGYSTGVDIFNSSNAQLTNEHYYDNGVDLDVIGNGTTLSLSSVVFDSPAGTFSDYTNISLSDALSPPLSGYSMDHATDPGSIPADLLSFEQKFVNITNSTPAVSIDSITWHWLDSELSGYNESRFLLYKFNSSGWTNMNAALDTGANTLALSGLDPQSVFAILQNNATESTPPNVTLISPPNNTNLTASSIYLSFSATDNLDSFISCMLVLDGLPNQTNPATANNTPTTFLASNNSEGTHTWAVQCSDNASNVGISETRVFSINLTAPPPSGGSGDGGGSGSGGNPDLSMAFDPDGNIVNVTSDGDPVPGATVRVNGSIIGTTDSNGQISFPGCGGTAYLSATKDGYSASELDVSLASCPACTVNADCPATMQCNSGTCGPVACACGTVSNHQCVPYACASGQACAACPEGQSCQNNTCVANEVCTSDAECQSTGYCDIPSGASGGSCKDVQMGACGQITDHKFVPYGYECGTEPGCPSCTSGACVDHKCVLFQITCPPEALVGEKTACSTNCPNCEVEVQGKKYMTDGSGKVEITFENQGVANVRLVKGSASAQTQVTVRSKATGTPEAPPTGTGDGGLGLLLLLIFIIIIVLGIVYWRAQSAKK